VWDPHELARLRTQYAVVLSVHRVGQAAAPGVLHDLEGETLTRLGTSGPAQYLIRPDGYVAFRAPGRSLVAVRGYLEQWFPGA
jgi:hypothetical protein